MADAAGAVKIELSGVVQGVGFRPWVWRLAQKHHISGLVRNVSGTVEVLAAGESVDVAAFLEDLRREPPAGARIEQLRVTDAPADCAEGFVIEESGEAAGAARFFPPDTALCSHCRDEIFDQSDRRARHFFNTCVSCGPRFSVLNAFPYDRRNTSMRDFALCPACQREYQNPADRRFHAETIACNDCGPVLRFQGRGVSFVGEDAFQSAVAALRGGDVVAIKGIGGYHFACLPDHAGALAALREMKGRDSKPFAVMFRNLDGIEAVCKVSGAERALLRSPECPIVLLRLTCDPFADEVLCGSGRCGCFLPYTPLHVLLMAEFPCLVMTSANAGGAPIVTDEEGIFSFCDTVLYHGRAIARQADDSVVQLACDEERQIVRRARGFVPGAVKLEAPCRILAVGGDLKASFALADGANVWMSQYFGDLEDPGVTERYQDGIDDFIRLFDIAPQLIVCDSHPRYFSAGLAEGLAKRFGVPLVRTGHHHAHVASVIAEHRLAGKVLGIAFDGSGYGEDGQMWGGEFLLCEGGGYRRVGHLGYTALLGADEAARDAQKTAACFLHGSGLPMVHPEREAMVAALEQGVNTCLSSSVGRLFDAVAALTGVCLENRYEGQCAAALQYAAEAAREGVPMSFSISERDGVLTLGAEELIRCAAYGGTVPEALALGFHVALAEAIVRLCLAVRARDGVSQVALSGGVFQNTLLLSLCTDGLEREGFAVYRNIQVPPNDGGLALGQCYIGGFWYVRRRADGDFGVG